MKRLLTMLCMASLSLAIHAVNNITLSTTSGHPGDEVTVSVAMTGSDAVTAMEMLIPLGEYLSYVEGSCVLAADRKADHEISAAVVNGSLRIYAYSTTLNSFKGNSGTLFTFNLKLGDAPGNFALSPTVTLSNTSGSAISSNESAGNVTIQCPALAVPSTAIDFGHVPIRSQYEKTLALQNTGNEPLTISNITANDSELSVSPSSLTIPAGSSSNVTVTYNPLKRVPFDATLTIESDAVNAKIFKQWQTAKVVADPFSENELHVVGASGASDTEVTIGLNMNNMEPIVGAQIALKLPDALRYVEGSATLSSRSNGHIITTTVDGENQLSLFIYSPDNTALKGDEGEIATFRVKVQGRSGSYSIKPETVILSNVSMENMTSATYGGTVQIASPRISCSSSLSFGEQALNSVLSAEYHIENIGNAPLTIEKATFLADGFNVTSALPMTIQSGQSADLNITYNATNRGGFSTIMNLYSKDPEQRVTAVEVSGVAYSSNELTLSGSFDSNKNYLLNVAMSNESEITAVQFDIATSDPSAISGDPVITPSERLKNHTASIFDMGKGVWKVIVYSMNNALITGSEGELMSISFPRTGNTSNVTYHIENAVISDKDGRDLASPVLSTNQEVEFEGVTMLLGDVNGDGKINSQDVFSVINVVLGRESSVSKAAADINGDGKVNSQDVFMVINKVLGK